MASQQNKHGFQSVATISSLGRIPQHNVSLICWILFSLFLSLVHFKLFAVVVCLCGVEWIRLFCGWRFFVRCCISFSFLVSYFCFRCSSERTKQRTVTIAATQENALAPKNWLSIKQHQLPALNEPRRLDCHRGRSRRHHQRRRHHNRSYTLQLSNMLVSRRVSRQCIVLDCSAGIFSVAFPVRFNVRLVF